MSRVSVVIPALNEAANIRRTLRAVRSASPLEVILVDGGSGDDTVHLAREEGAIVLRSPSGRARQMNAGAAHARGTVLLFLHADTFLPVGWDGVVHEVMNRPRVSAGAFRLCIEGDFVGKGIVEWGARLRSRWLQKPYGDQGIFVRRSLFEELGGFADLPIMEDYELTSRLRRRGRIVTAKEAAMTSGRRWRKLGVFRTTLINGLVVFGYRCGVPAGRLARLYRRPAVR